MLLRNRRFVYKLNLLNLLQTEIVPPGRADIAGLSLVKKNSGKHT